MESHQRLKPLLRGHFHQAAFFFALGACLVLIAHATSIRVLIPAVIYSISLVALFGISALYHRRSWEQRGRLIMKRLDHASIFVFIAATGTPICLLAMPADSGHRLLLTMWLATALGAGKTMVFVHSPKWLSAILYVFIGWIAVTFSGELHAALSWHFWFLVAGGVIYSLGAVAYALKRPNPWPRYFGYHEIFHVAVILGAILHFMVIEPLIV